jgi:acyl-coenzyme A synthetase/AMP-(fatty) acid ligase
MMSLFDQGPPPPCPDRFNMAAHVLAHAALLPDKIALAVIGPAGAERWNYARLEAAVRGTATGFLSLGLAPGDRVLMRLGNTVDFPIAYLASIAAGLIPVPTSSQLTAREITKLAAEIDPALITAADGVALPENPACPVMGLGELAAMRALPPLPYVIGDPNRPAYIIYTSGTAGQPRAVIHAHRAIWARQMMHEGWYGLTASDRLLHAGAFNWTYTLGTGLMDPWSVGATALIPETGVAPDTLGLLLKRHDATIFAAAPGVYRQMLRHPLPALPKLRHGLSAGEKLPDSTRNAWVEATGTAIHEAFGMSECSTFISGSPSHPAPHHSLGFAQPGRRIAILGEDAPVPIGQAGTIAVSSRDPGLMLGYLGAEEETKARYRGEWFLTGDTGEMDDTGAIRYLGRADDMMNAGGFRVSPIEVETAMRLFPGLTDCAAVELQIRPDVTVIAAFYTANEPLPETELAAHAEATLARYKQPRMFMHRAELPRGANNKLLRKALRQDYVLRADEQ